MRALLLLAAAALFTAQPARAAQVCAWLTETVDAEQTHQFDLWLEADADADILYAMTGQGIVTEGSRMYSPGSGTYSLHARRAERVWGFGGTLDPPGDVDIVAEIHEKPASIFDETSPLIAAFPFQRHVPEDEKAPPTDFQQRRCAPLPAAKK
ncbi:MAG TPA: hypothetical protein VFH92_09570 [Phenylobacterium sp.]|nr:hypothetical protein [Phenylobacterium sp.]